MSIRKSLTTEQQQAMSPNDKRILAEATALDKRFEAQFERLEFDYVHAKEDINYLPAAMANDKYLVRDRTIELSYTFWPAKNGDPKAKTIIVLGGIYQTARHSDFFAEQASETSNVVCFDYPGKGFSGSLYFAQDYNLSTYAKMVRALVDDLDPDQPFCILAHSHGAKILFTMVEQGFTHPNWESAVLGDMGPEAPERVKMLRTWHPRGATKYETITEGLEGMRKFARTQGNLPRDYFVNAFNNAMAYHSRPGDKGYGWAQDINAMLGYCQEYEGPYNKWEAYKKLPVPILLTVGKNSDTVNPELLKRMLEARPDASAFVFREAGHYPELVAPAHVREVQGWIQNQKAGKTLAPVRKEIEAVTYPPKPVAANANNRTPKP